MKIDKARVVRIQNLWTSFLDACDEQELISEYDLEEEPPVETELFEEVPQKKTGFFASLFGKKNKK